jgi:hypothetical protein
MADAKSVAAAMKVLGKTRVLVGIPMEHDPRQGEPLGNASIGYVHEFGSPARNTPARPFLRPGVRGSREEWVAHLKRAAQAALKAGNPTAAAAAVTAELTKAGIVAVNAVRKHIQAGIPPPLSPITVARRQRRSPGSSYRRKALSPADVTPLIDTGEMLRSITFVLEVQGKRGKPP